MTDFLRHEASERPLNQAAFAHKPEPSHLTFPRVVRPYPGRATPAASVFAAIHVK